MRPTVILLSFNSETTIRATLSRARLLSEEIFVVDSYSSDKTLEVAESLGANTIQHPFEHYGAQRNWAIDNLPITRPWQLHLDADELMDERLIAAIRDLSEDPTHDGYRWSSPSSTCPTVSSPPCDTLAHATRKRP